MENKYVELDTVATATESKNGFRSLGRKIDAMSRQLNRLALETGTNGPQIIQVQDSSNCMIILLSLTIFFTNALQYFIVTQYVC